MGRRTPAVELEGVEGRNLTLTKAHCNNANADVRLTAYKTLKRLPLQYASVGSNPVNKTDINEFVRLRKQATRSIKSDYRFISFVTKC